MDKVELRNKYRYSLGVTIDRLAREFGFNRSRRPFEERGPWPSLTDDLPGGRATDIWSFFDARIRPVIQDLNSYSFFLLGPGRFLKLKKLCDQLEIVVGETDAAIANNLVESPQQETLTPKADKTDEIKPLVGAYHELYKAWHRWQRQVDRMRR